MEKNTKQRKLNEYDVFIRDNIGLDIIKKVNYESKFYNEIVLPRNPFGFISSERGQKKNSQMQSSFYLVVVLDMLKRTQLKKILIL